MVPYQQRHSPWLCRQYRGGRQRKKELSDQNREFAGQLMRQLSGNGAVQLKGQPDGFGFFYGSFLDAAGEHYRLDVLPPRELWTGDLREEACAADNWIVYLNGEEVERASSVGTLPGRDDAAPPAAPLCRLRDYPISCRATPASGASGQQRFSPGPLGSADRLIVRHGWDSDDWPDLCVCTRCQFAFLPRTVFA